LHLPRLRPAMPLTACRSLPTVALAASLLSLSAAFAPPAQANGGSLISAGSLHTCALSGSGRVYCWGRGDYGQLGNGSTASSTVPVLTQGIRRGTVEFAASGYHGCALFASGNAKCWGHGRFGELGDGSANDKATPVSVSGLIGASAVTAGFYHSCALTGLGVVKCWGNNDYGQIGDNTTIHRVTPVEVLHLTGATALAAGFFHSCAVTGAGGVACWGGNLNGQLGDGTVINRKTPVAVVGLGDVTAVAANGRHSCALTKEGGVRCWGYGPRGQLGHGSFTGSLTPVIVNGLAGATAVVAGEDHSCALLKSGTVKCWGFNAFGQLGNGNTQSAASPVDVRDLTGVVALAAGRDHTCAYTECGLFCVTLLGCGQSPRESMAQCENDAQKATVGMVSNDSQIRSQIEAQRIELVRSCMVSHQAEWDAPAQLCRRYGFIA
jgi:alpha-tubulin suppressor-like RCC1 family protein